MQLRETCATGLLLHGLEELLVGETPVQTIDALSVLGEPVFSFEHSFDLNPLNHSDHQFSLIKSINLSLIKSIKLQKSSQSNPKNPPKIPRHPLLCRDRLQIMLHTRLCGGCTRAEIVSRSGVVVTCLCACECAAHPTQDACGRQPLPRPHLIGHVALWGFRVERDGGRRKWAASGKCLWMCCVTNILSGDI
jgi:hypothetical protein